MNRFNKAMNIREILRKRNRRFIENSDSSLRHETAEKGQNPYSIVLCCSDSRVIPERIFSADIGELFVIRVAGNVLDRHQIGSIEYAAEHLNCRHIIVLGHTGCGAIGAALSGGATGHIRSITDEILEAIGDEKDPDRACRLNVSHGVEKLKAVFAEDEGMDDMVIEGAVYDIKSGSVTWL